MKEYITHITVDYNLFINSSKIAYALYIQFSSMILQSLPATRVGPLFPPYFLYAWNDIYRKFTCGIQNNSPSPQSKDRDRLHKRVMHNNYSPTLQGAL
jgi:hypothetical protein